MDKLQLQNIFKSSYNTQTWQQVLHTIFGATELRREPKSLDNEGNENVEGFELGRIVTPDHYEIGLYEFEIKAKHKLAMNRVGLRGLVKSFLKFKVEAALVVYYDQNEWRLSFICDLRDEKTAPKRFTYLFGSNTETYRTPIERFLELAKHKINFAAIHDAFSVEKLSKEFFKDYKNQYDKFLKYIGADKKSNRDYVKKLLGRLVFLQFLQKKGWMGVPASNAVGDWNGGDKNYLLNLFRNSEYKDKFLERVLETLFFDTLNNERIHDVASPILGKNIRIPYLNGGLFEPDSTDRKATNFPADYFKELLEFFGQYNFTIDENDPQDAEVGIDPEMLGHIFENLLEDNKDKGAFYTPKEIVRYMCQQSLIEYLQTKLGKHEEIEEFIQSGTITGRNDRKNFIVANAKVIEHELDSVKICDPAIGSGAFPMGILSEIFKAKMALNLTLDPAEVKKKIIQNSIYGIDIEQGAVDIARLRFWLSLVVDEEIPQPLPNLDYKIMCGNSLLSRFELDMSFDDVFQEYNKGKNEADKISLAKYKKLVADYTNTSDHDKKDQFRATIEQIKSAFRTELSKREIGKLSKLKGRISDLEAPMLLGERTKTEKAELKKLKTQLTKLESNQADILNNKLYENAFEWRFEFPALLDEEGKFMGFDIVIGNPPYVNIANIRPDNYRNILKTKFRSAKNKSDLYVFFVEQGFEIMGNNGIMAYIIPHTWKATDSFQNLREIIFKYHKLNQIVNLEMGVFGAIVKPLIAIFSNVYEAEYTIKILNENFKLLSEIKSSEITKSKTFFIDTTSNIEEKTLYSKIENDSIALSSIVEFSRGIKTSNDKRFIVNEKQNDDCKKVFRGKNIKAYSLNWNKEYIWYRPDLMREKVGCVPYTKDFFETPEKLITQRVNSSSQLLVTYDNSQNYFLDTTNVSKYSTWDKNVSLKYLCGLLNSKVLNFWYCNKYRMPTIGIYELHSIPVKVSDNQLPFIDLVDKILEAKKSNPQADTSVLEAEIDLMVYKLYGLTYDEVLTIDPKTPITQVQYEQNEN